MTVHQDAEVFAAVLNEGETVSHALPAGRKAWLQVVRGAVALNGAELRAGDGAQAKDESALEMSGRSDGSEILLFSMP